ncbi:MAG: hypothetical protein V2A53_09790 [bacterium]
MITNELLEEKYQTQKKMARNANYSIKKLLDNAEKSVEKMLKEHGNVLKIADIKPIFG